MKDTNDEKMWLKDANNVDATKNPEHVPQTAGTRSQDMRAGKTKPWSPGWCSCCVELNMANSPMPTAALWWAWVNWLHLVQQCAFTIL